jgi:ArsR family transcriptional regulator, arsenate/arsenite/antimonite-responsive transcriptional repressor
MGETMVRRTALLNVATDDCCASVLAPNLAEGDADELARSFAALADPVRLRLLNLLGAAPEGEVCICNLVEPIGKSQPTISHHMKLLVEAGLVHGERRGKWVWYSLDRSRLATLRTAIDA